MRSSPKDRSGPPHWTLAAGEIARRVLRVIAESCLEIEGCAVAIDPDVDLVVPVGRPAAAVRLRGLFRKAVYVVVRQRAAADIDPTTPGEVPSPEVDDGADVAVVVRAYDVGSADG